MAATRTSAITSQIISDGEYAGRTLVYYWDPIGLTYVVGQQPAGGGGGGGGAVTVADGADVAQGATTDAEVAAGSGTVVAILKRLRTLLSNPLAVTGTFWQATQPVSGTFWQATQPVSGPLTDAQLRAVAVPVSGPLTDAQLRAAVVPVSGAFFQATQPVSIAAAVPVTDNAGSLTVDDGAGSLTTDSPQLPGALVGGRLDVNVGAAISLPVTLVDGGDVAQGAKADAVWDGVTVSTTISAVMKYIGQKVEALRVLVAGTLRSAKREIGYANVALYAEAVAGIIAETAITMSKSLAFAAPSTATSNGASAAKELVITGIIISWVSTSTTANTARLRIRVNPAGAAIISSPIAFTIRISWESATFIANEGELQPIIFAEPIVIPNPGQFMATIACVAANGTLDVQLIAYERTP